MASTRIEVLASDATLEQGARIDAPETAAPGATIEVSWSVESESDDQRITLARGQQPIFTWISAVKTDTGAPVEITLPETAGIYELRFLDVSNQAVLARKVIKVD
jgi:Ca-activated chloride channel family protein